MSDDAGGAMADEFDVVAGWTAQVSRALGPEYYLPAACRGSGDPSWLDWLLARRPDGSTLLVDVGAGMGGPAEYARRAAGVRTVLVEPAPQACRAAVELFGAATVQGDGTAVPVRSRGADVAWSLGVLCTAPDAPAQLRMLRELARIVRPGGRIGLLVFVAQVVSLTDPPEGNHFPSGRDLDRLVNAACLRVLDRVSAATLPSAPEKWSSRVGAVEHELQRRFGEQQAWQVAERQSAAIGRLLGDGELAASLLVAEVVAGRS